MNCPLKLLTARAVGTNLEVKLIFSNFNKPYFTKNIYIGTFCNYANFNSAEHM